MAADGDGAQASDGGGVGVEIEDAGGVLVDAQDEDVGRELLFHLEEAALAEVRVAGVVGAALGVVVMGDDGGPEAGVGDEVEAVEPVRLLPDLVDLVDGDGVGAEHESSGAGEGDGAATTELGAQHGGHRGFPPLLEGIRGRSGAGEDVVRVAQAGEHGLVGDGVVADV